MNRKTSLELSDVYQHISRRASTCRFARNSCPPNTHQRAMLAGKVKAYVDILAFLQSKYGLQSNNPLTHLSDI